jgi:hypothetical protein
MVYREVDSTSPRSPLSYRELLAAIPGKRALALRRFVYFSQYRAFAQSSGQ